MATSAPTILERPAFVATRATIRAGYLDKSVTCWTMAEASEYSGICEATIRRWLNKDDDGQRLFDWGHRKGPYIIDRHTFTQHLRTGLPQGAKK